MPRANIDIISADGGTLRGSGDVAHALMASGFNVNALRTNAVLRKDEWKQIDNALIGIARRRLVAVGELNARGLTHNINNGLGTTILEWEQVSDMDPAEVSMSGTTPSQGDTLDFTLQSMPLPIIHKDFSINIRKLEASRSTGQPLDTAQAAMASTLVAESVESMVFNGHATRVGASRIWGLLNHPNRNTGSLAASWDLPATSGQSMLDDTLAMIAAAQSDNMYGPYGMFVTQAAYTNMADDYKANGDKTILQRLLDIPGIEFIKPSRDVAAGNTVLFQLTSDVIDEVQGLQPTVVQWDSNGGMTVNFKVMAIMIPRVRATQTLQSGVVHFS